MRPKWPVDKEKNAADLQEADENTREARLERLEFLTQEFGPPFEMGLVGGLGAMFAISELQNSYLNGNYVGTILLCQVFVEHSIGGSYALAGDDLPMLQGFKKLINRALADGFIPAELGARLHELREMRNPYSHPQPHSRSGNLMERIVSQKQGAHETAEHDARQAICILVDFIREGCPSWGPVVMESRENGQD